jgi:hypothetical protein
VGEASAGLGRNMAGNFSISGFRLSGRHFAEMAKMTNVNFRLPSSVLGGDIFADSVCKRRFQRRLSEGLFETGGLIPPGLGASK